MATLASSLLDFILDLLRDPETAAEFQADPTGTLAAAGLDDVCPADVQNARLVLDELPPAGVVPSSVAAVTPVATSQFTAAAVPPVAAATTTQVSDATADADTDDVHSVVEQLRYIQQNFTYDVTTNVEVRDNVWAGKDVYQLFGDDSVMAAGGSVAAGDDVEDVRVDHSVEDSYNIDDSFNPENSGNTQTGTGNVNGNGNDLDNRDQSVNVDDSTGVNVGSGDLNGDSVSGVGNVVGNTVDVRDSGNDNSVSYDESFNRTDNSTDLDVDVRDSFNETDNSVNTDLDVDIETEDILVGDGNVGGDASLDASTNVADSGNTNTEVSDFLNDNVVAVDESIAARETEVDF